MLSAISPRMLIIMYYIDLSKTLCYTWFLNSLLLLSLQLLIGVKTVVLKQEHIHESESKIFLFFSFYPYIVICKHILCRIVLYEI